SASHGVAQIAGSCSYSPSDRVANPMSTVMCTADTVQCNMYAIQKTCYNVIMNSVVIFILNMIVYQYQSMM
ncbi:unnamed protein product, partial [Rotaria sp. Silwood2]